MKNKPVPMKEGATIETVAEYLARGGKIKKLAEGKAEGVYLATSIMTRPPVGERVSDPVPHTPPSERTKPVTGDFE